MIFRFLSNTCYVLGLGLLLVAGYLYFTDEERRVVIDKPEREVSDARAGRAIEVAFPIHNPTGEQARVVGLGHC